MVKEMFTGIIDHCGEIKTIENVNNGKRLWIACDFADLTEGESIALDGMCVTVVEPQNNLFCCDISPESLMKTIANHYQLGSQVNLERALQVGDRMGGHFVSGHVDQTAYVHSVEQQNEFTKIVISGIGKNNLVYLTTKGSIAVNGVSLTINLLTESGFEIMLIPHTLAQTTLQALRPDSLVNIEFDMLAKMVNRSLQSNIMDNTADPNILL